MKIEISWRNLVVAWVTGLLAAPCGADDFRIDTMVFADQGQDAICRTVTLFTDDRIYDRLSGDREEVTVIDMPNSQIAILDLGRSVRGQLSFDAIQAFVRDANTAARSSPTFVSFAATPRFDTVDDQNGSLLLLRGASLSYRVETRRAPNDHVIRQLKDFADWSARLNTMRPGLPPGARLELNQKLFQRKRIPTTVTCELEIDATHRRTLSARHEYSWQLSAEDRNQISRYEKFLHEFPTVNPHVILTAAANK